MPRSTGESSFSLRSSTGAIRRSSAAACAIVPRRSREKYSASALRKPLGLRELGLQARGVIARELPRVQALQRELARTAPRRFHLWLFAMLLRGSPFPPQPRRKSRPFCTARAFACSSCRW